MFLFGLAQAVLSQIPGLHEMAGLSVFAAVMSFFYSFVGVGLGVAKVIGRCCLTFVLFGISIAHDRRAHDDSFRSLQRTG